MRKYLLLAALLFSGHPATLRAQSAGGGCTLQRGSYTCDWQTFRARFANVRTVSIEAQPMDRATETQLRHLVEALGKTLAGPNHQSDAILRVAPADASGIAIGPSDQPLAILQIYARGPEGGRGALLWVETFSGQADRPWPMNVTAVTEQFEARFHRGGR